jgi:hypothetical protein
MISYKAINPFEYFSDTTGNALEGGQIYIGTAGLDAQTNPIAVYLDAAETIPATQPIATTNGYPSSGGAAVTIYTASTYSITVLDSNGALVYSLLTVDSDAILAPLTARVDAMAIPFATVPLFFAATLAEIKTAANTTTGTAYIEIKGSDDRFYLDLAQAADFQFTSAGGVEFSADYSEQEILTSAKVNFFGGEIVNLGDTIIKQANGANLAELVDINFSNATSARRATVDIHVDGNKSNNTAVTGITVNSIKKESAVIRLSSDQCDIGVRVTGNTEYLKGSLHAGNCGTGVLINTDGANTPDELTLDVFAHDCDTFFEASGTNKMTTHIVFSCEQSNSYGAKFSQGWHEIHGVLRAVGKTGAGGLFIDDDANMAGTIRILGGSDANCTWCADVQGGTLSGLTMITGSAFANGCRILGGTEGSARLIMQQAPAATGTETGLKLGDSAGTALQGFSILPGSYLSSGNDAINLDNANSCVIDAQGIVGNIVIASGSYDNTIYIPRRQAETVTFTNNRSAGDNKIIFRGAYTTAEMNTFNGGTSGSGCFKGMEVEACPTFDGARCYFDGNMWVPAHGLLATGVATMVSGTKTISSAHGVGLDPGNGALSFYLTGTGAGLGSVRGNVTSTNVTIISENNAAIDQDFQWSLRKID